MRTTLLMLAAAAAAIAAPPELTPGEQLAWTRLVSEQRLAQAEAARMEALRWRGDLAAQQSLADGLEPEHAQALGRMARSISARVAVAELQGVHRRPAELLRGLEEFEASRRGDEPCRLTADATWRCDPPVEQSESGEEAAPIEH